VNLRRVAEILNGPLVIVTESGVALRLPAPGWDAVDVARVIGEIASLPETSHPLGASA
jgi:hypothetical protein